MLAGIIVHGDGVGRNTGYPTANIKLPNSYKDFETGVYAGYAKLEGVDYKAAVIIQPQINKAEIYLLGYKGDDFYGKNLEARIVQKVSKMEKVSGTTLQNKIEEDIERIIAILQSNQTCITKQ